MSDPADNPAASAEDNRRMFDRIARRYDLLNAVLSLGLDRRWRRQAVAELLAGQPSSGGWHGWLAQPCPGSDQSSTAGPAFVEKTTAGMQASRATPEITRDGTLAPGPGQRVLDAGCGTGDVILEILRQCPLCRVTGIDLSEEMLRLAASKLARAGLTKSAELRKADASATGLGRGAFDGLITAFCFRNIVDRPAALREFHRLLASGGKLVILELTRPRRLLVRLGHRLYGRCFVPLAGRAVGHAGAYRYLTRSIKEFPTPQEVLSLLSAAGFHDAHVRPLTGGIVTVFSARNP